MVLVINNLQLRHYKEQPVPNLFRESNLYAGQSTHLDADETLQPLNWLPHSLLLSCMHGVEIASKLLRATSLAMTTAQIFQGSH